MKCAIFSRAGKLTGKIVRFTQAPAGEIDGFELDDGTTVHYPPILSGRVTSIVEKGSTVRVTGRSGGGPGTGVQSVRVLEARTIANLTTNQVLDLDKVMLDTPQTTSPSSPPGRLRDASDPTLVSPPVDR